MEKRKSMRTYEHAAAVLSQWLAARDMSAADFSRELGIDAGIVRAILTGRRKSISTRNLYLIARFFGVSMQQLVDTIS